jgi:hypothetical protein
VNDDATITRVLFFFFTPASEEETPLSGVAGSAAQ